MGPELSISAGSQQVTLMLLVHHPHLSSEAPFCKKKEIFFKSNICIFKQTQCFGRKIRAG